jgi:HEAT repeat protein
MGLLDFLFGRKKQATEIPRLTPKEVAPVATAFAGTPAMDWIECVRCSTRNPLTATNCRSCGRFLGEEDIEFTRSRLESQVAEPHFQSLKQKGDIDALFKLVQHGSTSVQELAILALRDIGTPHALELLLELLQGNVTWIRLWAADAIREIARAKPVDLGKVRDGCLLVLNDNDQYVREHALKLLAQVDSQAALDALHLALSDPEWLVRQCAVVALGELKDPRSLLPLLKAAEDADRSVQLNAIRSLGKLRTPQAIPVIVRALGFDDDYRIAACEALAELDGHPVVDPLLSLIVQDSSAYRRVSQKALMALGATRDLRALPAILDALGKTDVEWRMHAVKALARGRFPDPRALQALLTALKDSIWVIRRDAAEALGEIGNPEMLDELKVALKEEEKVDPKTPGRDSVIAKLREAIAKLEQQPKS